MSIKVQVIFYSMYGHVHKMAQAVEEGAKQVPGAEVSVYQVAELMPEDVLEKYGAKAAKAAFSKVPIATVDQLPEAHAIIFGTPTRFGNMAAQMRNFLDQTGPLWAKGALIGKIGSVFASNATRWSGNHDNELSHHFVASRNGDRRRALQRVRPHAHGRYHRRHALWRHHHCGLGWLAATE
jgi:NAD(P)H dehydrogenase (quinone)